MSIDSSAMDRYLKENNITLPKELERIRNMTMGDVVLENLQRHLGDDLKLSGSGRGLKEKKKKARKAKKNSQEPPRAAGGDEQSRFWMKVTTVVLSFGISVTLAYTFGIESTFVKQVMFGISAVIIFNFLLQKENARIIRTSNTLSMEEQEKKKK